MARPSKRSRQVRDLAKNIASLQVTQTHFHHQGPLPAPEQLQKYEQFMPGLADRIVRMAESESEHRRDLEQQLVAAQIQDVRTDRRIEARGQLFAIIIACIAIVGGVVVILHGNSIAGTVIGGVPLTALAGIFIQGRRAAAKQRPEEDAQRAAAIPGREQA